MCRLSSQLMMHLNLSFQSLHNHWTYHIYQRKCNWFNMDTSPLIVLYSLIIVTCFTYNSEAFCDSTTDGSRYCLRFSGYNDSQWATCRTDAYLRKNSNGTHGCVNGSTYCFYQCMLTKYGKDEGEVNATCKCSTEGSSVSTTIYPLNTTQPTPFLGTCNRFTGPSGASQCVKLSGYNNYQWLTCRENLYIQHNSGGKYRCKNDVKYCRYSCMLEVHGKTSGDVNSTCQCSSQPKVTTRKPQPKVTTRKPSPFIGECDSFAGPSGARQCVKLQGYNQKQWVTCRTDSYIREKSNNKHKCKDVFAKYCTYHCMLEEFGKSEGDVSGICRCSASQMAIYSFAYLVVLVTSSLFVSYFI